MGQPISEAKKAMFLQRAEARLNFARNLPAEDPKREAKIREANEEVVNHTPNSSQAPLHFRMIPRGGFLRGPAESPETQPLR